MDRPTIRAVYLYPIKALRGVEVPRAEVTPRGFARDRRLMLVDDAGRFVSQREVPGLATLTVALREDHVVVGAPDGSRVEVPLEAPTASPTEPVEIWADRVLAARVDAEVDTWLSRFAGRPLRLVRMPESVHRPVSPRWVPAGGSVSFADGFPYMAVTEAAVHELGRRLGRSLPAIQLRPNLVIAGPAAHAEDEWSGFRVGEAVFRCVKPCERCVVVTRDPETGVGRPEVMTELATYRRRDGKVWFGQNLMAERLGTVAIGDEVEVIRPSDHRSITVESTESV